jgi:hypothetical protein
MMPVVCELEAPQLTSGQAIGSPAKEGTMDTMWKLFLLYKEWRFRRWENRYVATMDDRFDIW